MVHETITFELLFIVIFTLSLIIPSILSDKEARNRFAGGVFLLTCIWVLSITGFIAKALGFNLISWGVF